MSDESTDRPDPAQADPKAAGPTDPTEAAPAEASGAGASEEPAEGTSPGEASEQKPERRRILIGSQRDPDAYRPKPKRDWEPVAGRRKQAEPEPAEAAGEQPAAEAVVEVAAVSPPPVETEAVDDVARVDEPPPAPDEVAAAEASAEAGVAEAPAEPDDELPLDESIDLADAERLVEELGPPPAGAGKFPPPSKRGQLPPDLEDEFQQALAGAELDELMAAGDQVAGQPMLEPDSKHAGRVVTIGREDVFIELGGREQGILPLRLFEAPPAVDAQLEVRVVRFNREDGLYELSLPGAAADVGDWSDLEEGMLVDARVTGHNSGGLECEVNRIRGFIPISQISLYRVENLEEFVGEKFTCLVTEANPDRRNLVLSRRAVLEREKEESRKQLLESLAPGQVHEGVVRKLMDFGAFVDLGGVDGLLHVSQLSWGRVSHPRDVLEEGQRIKVRVDKVDQQKGRISLSYRDMLENPWTDAERKYPPTANVKGKVSKLMEFGAFVELEPGVEGLVHISELSHKRVWRVSDVVKEGDEVEVVVLSVDPAAQRISLSMKDAMPKPESEKPKDPEQSEPPPTKKTPPRQPSQPLKGGLGRSPLGESFGLKW